MSNNVLKLMSSVHEPLLAQLKFKIPQITFSGTQNTVSILKVPKGPSHHNDSNSTARRGLITEEEMR